MMGFQLMSKAERRRISAMGGRAVQAAGTGHRFTPDKAHRAGLAGGAKVSADRGHMSRIGRRGALALHGLLRTKKDTILDMLADGLTPKEIAKRAGTTVTYVYKVRRAK